MEAKDKKKQEGMSPFEQAALDCYDEQFVYALLRADDAGWCELSDEFVAQAYERGNDEIKSFIKGHDYLISSVVLDRIFKEKDSEYLKEYLCKTQGRGMKPSHVVALIELGNQDLIDFFFFLHASMVWNDSFYAPVIEYLQDKGIYEKYREKYSGRRFW